VTAAVMGLVQRQPARSAVAIARLALVGAVGEGASDLIPAGALLARDLGVRRAVSDALAQPRAETPGHPLARRQLLVRLGERASAPLAAVAALAPHQPRHPPRDRQVPHRHEWAILDAQLPAAAVGAADGARDELDLQVELVAGPLHFGHGKALQPDKAGSLVLHPLFPPAPRSQTTRSLRGAADVSLLAPQPRRFGKTPLFNRP
jgi:hypothetical protein